MSEHTAEILWIVSCLGSMDPLDREHVAKRLRTREGLGICALNMLENPCGRVDGSR
jgi:hypothetical protein